MVGGEGGGSGGEMNNEDSKGTAAHEILMLTSTVLSLLTNRKCSHLHDDEKN